MCFGVCMRKSWSLRKIIHIVLTIVLAIVIVFALYYATDSKRVSCETLELDSGWNATVRGVTSNNVSLSDFVFATTNRGDEITFETRIPEDSHIVDPVLDLYSVHSTVEVYLDGEEIYNYGLEDAAEGKIIGYGNHYIRLPDDYAGKTLLVHFVVTENNAFTGVPVMKIMQGDTMLQKTLSNGRVRLMVCIFLIAFGLLAMFIGLLMMSDSSQFGRVLCIGVFSVLIGTWTSCNYDLITLFVPNLKVKIYMEYFSFYLQPIPFFLYFRSRVTDPVEPKAFRVLYYLILGFAVALPIVALWCHIFNLVHLPAFLKYSHAILITGIIYLIIFGIYCIKKHRVFAKATTYAFGFLLLCTAFELAKFNLASRLYGFDHNEYSSTLCFAALVIVIALLLDSAISFKETLYQVTRQKVLEQMAYEDELTGLGNRYMFDQTIEEIERDDKRFFILSVDLNFLKQINDIHGHEEGDKVIRECADILRTAFSDIGTVCRTGGDEFVVIVEGRFKSRIDTAIHLMNMNIEAANKQNRPYSISVAYGLADSGEGEHRLSTSSVLRVADSYMYEMKREMKAVRED